MKTICILSLLIVSCFDQVGAGTPAPEQFVLQKLEHLGKPDYANATWVQRYYTWDKSFQGPGHPIFMIMGGEGAIEPSTGLMYPFVTEHLAVQFGAYVLQPEHRFYGSSQPIEDPAAMAEKIGYDPRIDLLTPEQALLDALGLLELVQERLGCSKDKFSDKYCPVITVGGSYPGFLSAMARIMYPHKIDMAYSGSAPIFFYSQHVPQNAYYDHITDVAEKAYAGCAKAVKDTLVDVQEIILANELHPGAIGICQDSIPKYITSKKMFADELFMVVGYTFANDNMAYYPPDENSRLYKACDIFSNGEKSSVEKLREFYLFHLAKPQADCWDMSVQVPRGPNATITGGDWSGVGTGVSGDSWDFQTCTLCVEAIGFSEESMFPARPWSMDWLKKHCASRYPGVVPQPYKMAEQWKFDDLARTNVTRIVFTNGLNDGWSVSGIQSNLSDSLLAINFPNGAHHSDLSGTGPSERDTDDIKQGYDSIRQILSGWLDELKELREQSYHS